MKDRVELAIAGFDQGTLKECPFCGGKAKLGDAGYGDWAVFCQGCGANVRNDVNAVTNAIKPREFNHPICTIGINIQNVVAKWNRRMTP